MQCAQQTVGRPDAAAALRVRPVRASVAARGAVRTAATWGNRSCHNGAHLTKERKAELERICEHIAQRGKGITACDEGARVFSRSRLRFCSRARLAAAPRARCHARCHPHAYFRVLRPGPGTIGDRFAKARRNATRRVHGSGAFAPAARRASALPPHARRRTRPHTHCCALPCRRAARPPACGALTALSAPRTRLALRTARRRAARTARCCSRRPAPTTTCAPPSWTPRRCTSAARAPGRRCSRTA